MLSFFTKNKILFFCLALYFGIAGSMAYIQERGTAVLYFNVRHSIALDYFFKYITYLGDGLFAFPFIALVGLYRSLYKAIVLLASVLGSFIVVQILKLYVFSDLHRPLKYFGDSVQLYRVEGVELHGHHSFPSGHSAQAFALFCILSLFVNKPRWTVVFFILAILVTVSRMYLAQHFLADTFAGATIATVISLSIYYYIENHTTLQTKERLQRGWLK